MRCQITPKNTGKVCELVKQIAKALKSHFTQNTYRFSEEAVKMGNSTSMSVCLFDCIVTHINAS